MDETLKRARNLLAKLVGRITLRRDEDHLVAELRGNLPVILELEDELYNRGAGRGILFERRARVRMA